MRIKINFEQKGIQNKPCSFTYLSIIRVRANEVEDMLGLIRPSIKYIDFYYIMILSR